MPYASDYTHNVETILVVHSFGEWPNYAKLNAIGSELTKKVQIYIDHADIPMTLKVGHHNWIWYGV